MKASLEAARDHPADHPPRDRSKDRLGRYRWAVERTIAWLKNFRRLRVRDERRAHIHLAWLILACAMIFFYQLSKPYC